MKILIVIVLMCYTLTCVAQSPEGKYVVQSIEDIKGFSGVVLTINLIVKDKPADNKTILYTLVDHENEGILTSASDKKGVIELTLLRLKHVRYILIGSLEEKARRIELSKFKGKRATIELEVEPNRKPYH